MPYRIRRTLWALTLTGIVLYVWQSALAESDSLTVRYGVATLITAGAAWWAGRKTPRHPTPPPEPTVLALAALTSLSLWAAIWWLMDATNYLLQQAVGPPAWPRSIVALDDPLLGLRLAPLSYELTVLFSVVLLPLAQGWLLWGRLQPALTASLGARRALPAVAFLGGALLTLSATQGVTPALPGGVAALAGYILLALIAALTAHLSGWAGTGVVVHASFAYASFAWQDDLFRAFLGVDYLSPRWLTVIVLGSLGAVFCLQILRFRGQRPSPAPHPPRPLRRADRWPVLLLALALTVLTVRDVSARHDEAQRRSLPTASQATQQ